MGGFCHPVSCVLMGQKAYEGSGKRALISKPDLTPLAISFSLCSNFRGEGENLNECGSVLGRKQPEIGSGKQGCLTEIREYSKDIFPSLTLALTRHISG